MAIRAVYLPSPLITGNDIHIDGEEHRHLTVARAEIGETIEVFDGKGTVWTAAVESVNKRETTVKISQRRAIERDPVDVILGLAMIRGAAFELALEKAVEVGVTRIVPFAASRSNVSGGERHERWVRILVEAAKRSKHYYVAELDSPRKFQEVLSIPAASRILFAERNGGPLRSALVGSPVIYLIGPEGGWTDGEVSDAERAGFHPVSLGAGILKAETAAIVGGALIRYEMGKLLSGETA